MAHETAWIVILGGFGGMHVNRWLRRVRRALVACAGVVLAAAVVVAAPGAGPAGAASGAARWSYDAAADATAAGYLTSVSCADASHCVALGRFGSTQSYASMVWNGSDWTTVPIAVPAVASTPGLTIYTWLNGGISCPSATFCVATGELASWPPVGSPLQPLVETWNGSTWSVAVAPTSWSTSTATNTSGWFDGVSCASTTWCVAVGEGTTPAQDVLVEQFDGSSWTRVATPAVAGGLGSVSCPSPSSCMAVGTATPADPSEIGPPISLSWDGTGWTQRAVPVTSDDAALDGVSCPSATDCFTVGSQVFGGLDGTQLTLVEKWDGATWSVVPSPNLVADGTSAGSGLGYAGGGLSGVSCVNASACVAVGSGETTDGDVTPIIATWDGSGWSLTPPPAPLEPLNAAGIPLDGVSCSAGPAVGCTAVGSQTATDGTSTALVATTSSAIGDLVPTTTTVTPDPSSAASGVDEAVTVTVTSPSGVGVPSGSITVLDNGAPSPSCLPESLSAVSPPTVTCTLQAAVGDDISAEYSGDGTFDASSGSADVTAVGTPPPVGNPPPPPVELPVGAVGGPLAAVALGVGLFGVQRRRSRRARDVAGR